MPELPNPKVLPDHLIALSDEVENPWALWRTVAVRGAGFPVAEVLRIADPECAAAADRLSAAEDEAEERREEVRAALRQELQGKAGERRAILKALERLDRGKAPGGEGLAAATVAAVARWQTAAAQDTARRAEYESAFAAAEERQSRALRAAAEGERFREAIAWQNPQAARTGLGSLRRRTEEDGRGNSQDRAHERMLAAYLQRYSTKNDTIGFFGPVGWARLGEGDEAIAVRPGPDLLATRQVYFEGWTIDALADLLAADPEMRPWLAPRRTPFLRRQGAGFVGPGGPVQMGPVSRALYESCDGVRPARELIRALLEDPALQTPDERTLYGLLASFHTNSLVSWTFQIPLSLTPERTLRELLLTVGDDSLRERALALLDGLVAARDGVARAAGRAAEVADALGELEATFERATGRAAQRAPGQLYAGRALVFEDCRRDLDVELGAPFLADLAPALSLLLAGARWYTGTLAAHHRELLEEIHAEMSREVGSPILDVLSFSARALPALVNSEVQEGLPHELHARWARLLPIPDGARRVAFSSAELRPRVLAEFAAAGPGWERARVHSPDVLLAASDVAAIRRGEYQIVLGEVHLTVNTLDRGVFLAQHPAPDELIAAIEADLPAPTLVPVMPKHWRLEGAPDLGFQPPGFTARVDVGVRSIKDFHLDFTTDPPCAPASRVLRICDLVVAPGEDGLVVASSDSSNPLAADIRLDLVDFYQIAMMVQAIKTFTVLPARAHTPRLSIDRLVITREAWTFPTAALELARGGTAAERFAATRRWARGHGMPRFLFVKTPLERKPFYLDLESPVLVEIFAREVRRLARVLPEAAITVTEMLPAPDEAWLPDAAGNRYTCELRMVAVDRS